VSHMLDRALQITQEMQEQMATYYAGNFAASEEKVDAGAASELNRTDESESGDSNSGISSAPPDDSGSNPS
jgi:hypothetical protein